MLRAGKREDRPCLYPRLANNESSSRSVPSLLLLALGLRLDPTIGLCAAILLAGEVIIARGEPKLRAELIRSTCPVQVGGMGHQGSVGSTISHNMPTNISTLACVECELIRQTVVLVFEFRHEFARKLDAVFH